MKYRAFLVFAIFLIVIIPLPIYGQSAQECGPGLIKDLSTGQCILQCGEGTELKGSLCVEKSDNIDFGQIEAIAVGIIGGLVATAFGIGWTIKTRSEEREKEDLELIQNYGNQLSEITIEEENLETKLDCSLYAERYLDSLDQMATLLFKDLIRRDVADYFENQFRYGMNLWYWYKENVEKSPEELLDKEFNFGFEEVNEGTGYKYIEENQKLLKENEEDRWYYFRWWCFETESDKGQKNKKERFSPFNLKSRLELVEKRLLLFKKYKDQSLETKIRINILEDLRKHFATKNTDEENDEKYIYEIAKKHTEKLPPDSELVKKLSPYVFINKYSKKEQYGILPETMESDFDDIPDENGMSKFEVVETIQRFGEIMNNISSKEKDLNSKLDCSLYVEQYLDTLEQVATLYHKRVIPKKAADYFENKFSYGINLLNWYNEYVNKKPSEFDPSSEGFGDEENKEEERWRDFKWFCRGGDTRKIKITKFKEEEEKKKRKILPDVMYDYNFLPNEEGLRPSEVLEIMRNYSKQLTDLSGREPDLQTKIDCSVYAEQYLDTLEQIAYLFNKKSLATDAVTYFENNFSYGLTLKKWYSLAVIGAEEQEERWKEFDSYCKNFKDEEGNEKEITPFTIENTLPTAMLYYKTLPTDKHQEKYKGEFDYKLEF